MYLELVYIFVTILSGYVLFQWNTQNNEKQMPPGPWQWPILGNLIQVGKAHPKFPHLAMHSLAEKYGEIMTLKFGIHNTIVLSSFKTIKDLLGQNEFSGRYDEFYFVKERSFQQVLGVLFMSGDLWNKSRRYTLRGLRDLGFGKRSSMESIMAVELEEFMEMLVNKASVPESKSKVTINGDLFTPNIVNLVWSYMTGTRFESNDPSIAKIIAMNMAAVDTMNISNFSLPFPILRKWFPWATGVAADANTYKKLQDFMRDLLNKLRADWKARTLANGSLMESQTFIESYLQEIESNAGKSNQETIFTEEHLIMLMKDMFMAGSETTSNSLAWAMLYMVLYPEVQGRIQKEIEAVVPPGAFISMDYLPKMPYTEAVMLEIFRFANVIPVHYRKTLDEVEYDGYTIPKNTCVFFNQYSVLMDANFWGDPLTFRPERFLCEKQQKVLNKERVIIFGYGKRQCLGESVARNSFFVFLTTLLRKFTFTYPPGTTPPRADSQESFTLKPYDFEVLIHIN